MNPESTLILAIIGHLVGDYLLQNDWMALNKKNDWWPCAVHCFLWTSAVLFFSGWLFIPGLRGLVIVVILFWTHFLQDNTQIVKFWMVHINRQSKFTEPPMAPWSLIVVDNVWHIVALWAVWRFLVMV